MAKRQVGAKVVGGRALPSQELGNITIGGTKFVILSDQSPSSQERAGRPRVAKMMRENKIKRTLGVQRPNGSVVFMVDQFESGRFGEPVRIGR